MKRAKIIVEPDQELGLISPHIYGHFIEHLGRCIYGGIWAEMLWNRKFAGHDPDHNGVAERWLPTAPWSDNVYYTLDNTYFFSGNQSQRIEIMNEDGKAYGVMQSGLSIIKDREYIVSLNMKALDLKGEVTISLGNWKKAYASHTIKSVGSSWENFSFSLTSEVTDRDASFSITFRTKGSLWIGTASLMPKDNCQGMRIDTLEVIKAIKPPNIRWPGGNFASGYNWEDGIGARDKRPTRFDRAWHDALEPNDFGVDEFIQFCREVDTEPYICVNAGEGTPEEAARWVEYCNGSVDTEYGKKRANNGHPEPYDVKLWGVGNETYGNWQLGHVDAETYGRKCLKFASAMRKVDPTIKLVAVGVNERDFHDWNERVLRIAGEEIDYLSSHHYIPGHFPTYNTPPAKELYLGVVGFPLEFEQILKNTREVINKSTPKGSEILIAYDEWNVWEGTEADGSERTYALRDGLYAAGMLHAFQRECESVAIANLAQLVNASGAITTNQTEVVVTPNYLAFQLYINHFGHTLISSQVDCDSYAIDGFENVHPNDKVPYLDCSASLDKENKRLFIAVINRDPDENIKTELELSDAGVQSGAVVWELNGPSALARNTFEEKVKITKKILTGASVNFEYIFPAHSVTIIEFEY